MGLKIHGMLFHKILYLKVRFPHLECSGYGYSNSRWRQWFQRPTMNEQLTKPSSRGGTVHGRMVRNQFLLFWWCRGSQKNNTLSFWINLSVRVHPVIRLTSGSWRIQRPTRSQIVWSKLGTRLVRRTQRRPKQPCSTHGCKLGSISPCYLTRKKIVKSKCNWMVQDMTRILYMWFNHCGSYIYIILYIYHVDPPKPPFM
jgi:hypothetical protein